MSSSRRLAKAPETIPEEFEPRARIPQPPGPSQTSRGARISNACDQCQRRKTKCTGRPSPCEACAKAELSCHFEPKPTARNRGKSVYSAEDERLQYLLNAIMTTIKHSDDKSLSGLVDTLRSGQPPHEVAAHLRHNLSTLQNQGLIQKKNLDHLELLSLAAKIQSSIQSSQQASETEAPVPMVTDNSSSLSTFPSRRQIPFPEPAHQDPYSAHSTQQHRVMDDPPDPGAFEHSVLQASYLASMTQQPYLDPASGEPQVIQSPQWPRSLPYSSHFPDPSASDPPPSTAFQRPSTASWYATRHQTPFLQQTCNTEIPSQPLNENIFPENPLHIIAPSQAQMGMQMQMQANTNRNVYSAATAGHTTQQPPIQGFVAPREPLSQYQSPVDDDARMGDPSENALCQQQ